MNNSGIVSCSTNQSNLGDNSITDVLQSVVKHVRKGEYQLAYDAVMAAITMFPENKRLKSAHNFIVTAHDKNQKLVLENEITGQLFDYWQSSPRYRQLYYHELKKNSEILKERFINAGMIVEERRIDVHSFERWLASFPEMYEHYSGSVATIEKCLEHYLTFDWLTIRPNDLFIDIASAQSKWADILLGRGYNTYKLDLEYPPGIRGREIGADAGNSGLPDNSTSVLALHCAYETFINDADIRFIREAGRILRPGGRLAITPLYTAEYYFIMSCAHLDLSNHHLDVGAIRIWREDDWEVNFSRHYSPEAFTERIYSQRGPLKGKIVYFNNLTELRERYPGQRIYCDFMFFAIKP